MLRVRNLTGLVLFALALHAAPAHALRLQPRPHWMAGVGLGYGRGAFEDPAGNRTSYRGGPAFQVRFGRSLGQHALIGAYYDTWMIEYGEVPTKFRDVQQGLGLGFTCYPGSPTGLTGGIFLRASGGMGWVGYAEKPAIPGEAQQEGERIDEWGFNVSFDAGYEFWIARNFTAGLAAAFSYAGIDDTLTDRAGFAALVFDLNFYF